jgi:hypothetical protein
MKIDITKANDRRVSASLDEPALNRPVDFRQNIDYSLPRAPRRHRQRAQGSRLGSSRGLVRLLILTKRVRLVNRHSRKVRNTEGRPSSGVRESRELTMNQLEVKPMTTITKDQQEQLSRMVQSHRFGYVLQALMDACYDNAANYRSGSPMSNKWMARVNRLAELLKAEKEDLEARQGR